VLVEKQMKKYIFLYGQYFSRNEGTIAKDHDRKNSNESLNS